MYRVRFLFRRAIVDCSRCVRSGFDQLMGWLAQQQQPFDAQSHLVRIVVVFVCELC
jgi:hypothetical protein